MSIRLSLAPGSSRLPSAWRAVLLLAALVLPLAASVAQAAGLMVLAQALNAPVPATPRLAAPVGVLSRPTLYYAGQDSAHGAELWKTDGTARGTVLVADIHPGAGGSQPRDLTAFNGQVYFAANDGAHGSELWRSDGTAAGTRLVADINPDAADANIRNLTVVGANLFFTADDGQHGDELWVFDGHAASLVLDINAGGRGSGAARLTNFNGHLLFAADDGVHGLQLWRSDGGPVNTGMLQMPTAGAPAGLAWVAAGAPDLLALTALPRRADERPGRGQVPARNLSPSLGNSALWLTAAGNSQFFTQAAGTRGWDLWDRAGPRQLRPHSPFSQHSPVLTSPTQFHPPDPIRC